MQEWQQASDYYDDFETYARFLQSGGDENATCGGATFPDACFFKGLGCRPTPDSVVLDTMGLRRADYTWMSTIGGPNEAFGHIALPYLPFFSNCEGHDSFVNIGKLLGKCARVCDAEIVTARGVLRLCSCHDALAAVYFMQRITLIALMRTTVRLYSCHNILGTISLRRLLTHAASARRKYVPMKSVTPLCRTMVYQRTATLKKISPR